MIQARRGSARMVSIKNEDLPTFLSLMRSVRSSTYLYNGLAQLQRDHVSRLLEAAEFTFTSDEDTKEF